MTSIAPVNPKHAQTGLPSLEPAIWLPGTGSACSAEDLSVVRELDWPVWSSSKGMPRNLIGMALLEFMADCPGRPLLMMAAGLKLSAKDATNLAAIAGRWNEPVVLSVLSNAAPDFNPFSDLDVSQWPNESADGRPRDWNQLADLVRLLGDGSLHPLDSWPGHLLFLSPEAVRVLADERVNSVTAYAHLQRHGGKLFVADSIFAPDTNRPINLGPTLQPHEQRRPAPWGDLTARLEQWLDCGARLPEKPDAEDLRATLHVTHSWGGGVAQWVESFIDADKDGCSFQLRSEGPQSGFGAGQRLSLYAGNELKAPVASWWLSPPIRSSSRNDPQYREILQGVRQRHGIGRIIVSSLVGHSLDALRTELPTLQILHDFYPAWPLLGVHPQPFLEAGRSEGLQKALRQNELLPDFRGIDSEAWIALADDWRETVSSHQVKLAAPGESVAAMLRKLDGHWLETEIDLIPHGLAPLHSDGPVIPRKRPDGKLRLVVPGRIQEGKGQSLLLAALPELTRYAQVYLLGAGKQAEAFFGQSGVNIILQYQRRDLPRLMQAIGADVAALLSIVPETFSYTLSEMQYLGVPVIATRVGSLAERIRDGHDGWLIEPNEDALVQMVAELARDPRLLGKARTHLGKMQHFSAADMVQRYNDSCPALGFEPDVSGIPALADVQYAAMAELNARLQAENRHQRQQTRKLKAEIEQRTEWAMERQQALVEEQLRRKRWVQSLEQELKEERQQRDRWVSSLEKDLKAEQEAHSNNVQNLQSQLDLILQSSSWRITRPLRAIRRVAVNLRSARAWNPSRWPLLISQAVRTVITLGMRGAILRLQQSPENETAPITSIARHLEPAGNPEPPQCMQRAAPPLVSVVIPVYNQWLHTAACLRSINRARNEAGFEVIVVDDHSSDQTAARLAQVDGLELIRNPQNLGFVDSCNRGADSAMGKFIVLLNNDTQVQDGWLDALLETFEKFPDTGLAGARLIYPDGRLQEAGGIVFRDGSGWNYGRDDDPDRPEYGYTREVDYCSGACVMMPAALFRHLGGFDPRYAPAYYEDTDLAFRVREAGLKVRLQAGCTIVHHEGVTSGTDTGKGVKRFQDINRSKFLDRWRDQLADYPEPISDPSVQSAVRRARDHRIQGRVLVIDAYTPEPDQDSGSLRLSYLFDCFQQLGYGVSFFADNRGYAGHYSAELQKSGVEVHYNPWIGSLQDFFQSRGPEFDFIMISRHYVAANYISLIRRYCPRAKFIFDTVDLHYLREQRLAALENSLPLKRAAEQTRRSELAVIGQAAATLVVSEAEKKVLAEDAPEARVYVLSNIHEVRPRQQDFSSRKDILFIGGYQHPPNIDAAQWFVGSIWPLILKELPGVSFHLIGSKAPDRVRALHGNGVIFHGHVKDLAPWLNGCRLAVAPLRYGAGVKGKVNLSMSHGQPVVATTMAVEGVYAQPGHDVLVADTATDFALDVVRLYRDESLWNRLSEAGQENVRRHFSVDCARESLKHILESLKADP